jgi:hypothetical protein
VRAAAHGTHAEGIEIAFDTAQTSYRRILSISSKSTIPRQGIARSRLHGARTHGRCGPRVRARRHLGGGPSELLGHWAQALYFAGDRQWTPQLQALTDEALASNPQEAASLKLVGMAAFQAGRYAAIHDGLVYTRKHLNLDLDETARVVQSRAAAGEWIASLS